MKKLIVLLMVVIALMFSCKKSNDSSTDAKGGKYQDAKEVMGQFADIASTFVKAVDSASDAEAIANAVNAYVDSTTALKPKMDEIDAKYPELKNRDNSADIPDELKDSISNINSVMEGFMGALMKVQQFATDAKVKEAMDKFSALK